MLCLNAARWNFGLVNLPGCMTGSGILDLKILDQITPGALIACHPEVEIPFCQLLAMLTTSIRL